MPDQHGELAGDRHGCDLMAALVADAQEATDRRERCKVSSPCTQLPATVFQLHPATLLHKQFATIASRLSMPGKLRPASPENSIHRNASQAERLNVTTPPSFVSAQARPVEPPWNVSVCLWCGMGGTVRSPPIHGFLADMSPFGANI